jgi:hypothetical protein
MHGLYIAGYVSTEYTEKEEKNECGKCACSLQSHGFSHVRRNSQRGSHDPLQHDPANHSTGEVTKIVRLWRRGYNARVYDLGRGPAESCILIPRSSSDRQKWLQSAEDPKNHGVFSWLGPIRAGLDEEAIVADAGMQLAHMGKYDLLSNNCYTFVNLIYRVEKQY